MSVLKEWCCIAHGDFDASHPICPCDGCDSSEVTRVFRTAPSLSKGKYKRFDQGLRKSSEMMGIDNFKTAKEGESAFAGRGTDAPPGSEVLWGGDAQKKLGMAFPALTEMAKRPLNVAAHDRYSQSNNGIAGVMNESSRLQRLASRATPLAGEVSSADKNERGKAQGLVG